MTTLNEDTTVQDCTIQMKKDAMAKCNRSMKPLLDAIKEGNRRVRGAGFKPSKGLDTESASEK